MRSVHLVKLYAIFSTVFGVSQQEIRQTSGQVQCGARGRGDIAWNEYFEVSPADVVSNSTDHY